MPRTKEKKPIEIDSDIFGQEEEVKDTPAVEKGEEVDEDDLGIVDAVGFDDEINPFGDKWEI